MTQVSSQKFKKGDQVRVKLPARYVGEVGVIQNVLSFNEAEVWFANLKDTIDLPTSVLELVKV
jgi:hypothetical protein